MLTEHIISISDEEGRPLNILKSHLAAVQVPFVLVVERSCKEKIYSWTIWEKIHNHV